MGWLGDFPALPPVDLWNLLVFDSTVDTSIYVLSLLLQIASSNMPGGWGVTNSAMPLLSAKCSSLSAQLSLLVVEVAEHRPPPYNQFYTP